MFVQSDGEGLQVCVPTQNNLEYLYTEKEIAKPLKLQSVGYSLQDRILTVENEGAKEVQFPRDLGQFYSTPTPSKRVCGLPTTIFWLVFTITVLLAVIGVICGIIGGMISKKEESPPTLSQTTLTNETSTVTHSIRLPSTSSLGSSTTSTSISVPSPSVIGDFIYLGCYQDQTRRTLTGNYTSSPHMTNAMCATYCTESTYFGTEFGMLQYLN
jgi:hypothetical protein